MGVLAHGHLQMDVSWPRSRVRCRRKSSSPPKQLKYDRASFLFYCFHGNLTVQIRGGTGSIVWPLASHITSCDRERKRVNEGISDPSARDGSQRRQEIKQRAALINVISGLFLHGPLKFIALVCLSNYIYTGFITMWKLIHRVTPIDSAPAKILETCDCYTSSYQSVDYILISYSEKSEQVHCRIRTLVIESNRKGGRCDNCLQMIKCLHQ